MDSRTNVIRSVRFECPAHVPVYFHIHKSCWESYSKEFLTELIDSHSNVFAEDSVSLASYQNENIYLDTVGDTYTDPFGCEWKSNSLNPIGTVISHPFSDWGALESFACPDAEHFNGKIPVNWNQVKEHIEDCKSKNIFADSALAHGFLFETLCNLRGFENLLCDMADGVVELKKLIGMLTEYNVDVASRYLELGVDSLCLPDDLGSQSSLMISPEFFREYLLGSYCEIIRLAKSKEVIVTFHSDGCIREIAGDLIDAGVDVLNVQDAVNGVDWIRDNIKGRVCVDVDIDRQQVTSFGRAEEIDLYIKMVVDSLGSKQGGLMLTYALYPGIPEENVVAVADAMEKYAFNQPL